MIAPLPGYNVRGKDISLDDAKVRGGKDTKEVYTEFLILHLDPFLIQVRIFFVVLNK